jgi:hypothetical protein
MGSAISSYQRIPSIPTLGFLKTRLNEDWGAEHNGFANLAISLFSFGLRFQYCIQ